MKRSILLGLGLVLSPAARAADVVICYSGPSNADVVDKLVDTEVLDLVDSIDCSVQAPTLDQLLPYDAVLVYSEWGFLNPGQIGNVLADFVDTGGGVVEALNANAGGLGGRFANEDYEPFSGPWSTWAGIVLTLVEDDPTHPILEGVDTFEGGIASLHISNPLIEPDATRVASWSNGQPLVVVSETFEGRVVGLNMLPLSDAVFPEYWNSATDGGLLMANALAWAANPDPDEDGILTETDNCPEVANPFQENEDGDLLGDVCDPCNDLVDPDPDADTVCNSVDICPGGDDRIDADADTLPDTCDRCPVDADPTDGDGDGDGIGDVCDVCPLPSDPEDSDLDTVCNNADVCPGWDDLENNDGDPFPNGCDICPFAFDPSQADSDDDGEGDACDVCPTPEDPVDTDEDSYCDNVDLCPGFDDDRDYDGDGVPDDCDVCKWDENDDTDGDTVCDTDDRCDGIDDLGYDSDYDTIPDECDNCIDVFNETQRDFDGDGFGDECDCRIGHAEEFPGSEEICDGEDNDCDGEVDEDAVDAVEYWIDADGDGLGNPNALVMGCAPAADRVTNSDDCDDSSAEARIGGNEICDNLDNDCDGVTDPVELCPEEEPPAETPASEGCGCDQPAGGSWGWASMALLLAVRRRRALV